MDEDSSCGAGDLEDASGTLWITSVESDGVDGLGVGVGVGVAHLNTPGEPFRREISSWAAWS